MLLIVVLNMKKHIKSYIFLSFILQRLNRMGKPIQESSLFNDVVDSIQGEIIRISLRKKIRNQLARFL